jgi:L-alanine-DL-glutamate epimerase-like enolase superfamily enzyme
VALYRSVISETPDAMAERARGYVRDGYQRIQVKVGADPLADAERLRAVRDAVGAAVALVCDANGTWGTATALRFLHATRELDYVLEQPCATLA